MTWTTETMVAKRRNCRQISPSSLIHMRSFHTNPPAMHPMKPSLLICALGMLLLTGAPRALAASFDCGKATGTTETLICRDAQTSALDDKLQQAYKAALRAVDPSSKQALIEEQRHWIAHTRNICQDEACLQQAYTARNAVLDRNEKYITNGKPSCIIPNGIDHVSGHACGVYVVTYRDPNNRIDSFNQSLAQEKQAGKIIGCSKLIDLPLGTAQGDHVFGGICTLQTDKSRKDVEICNDNMTGAFQMRPTDLLNTTGRRLIDFTYAQCYASPASP